VVELVERAKAAGRLREDFAGEDLLLIANSAIVHVTRSDAPAAWRRFVALVLDAFRCPDVPAAPAPGLPAPGLPAPGLPAPAAPAAPTTAQMARAMLRLARERGCGKHS
jgi:hypothetical protein